MDAFQFRRLSAAPGPDDTIAVYAAGTLDLLGDLTDLAGAPLANPFAPGTAGGVGAWGFRTASLVRVDIWWEQGGIYLAKDTTVGGRQAPFEQAGAVAEHEADAAHFARTAYQLSLSDAIDITLPSGLSGKYIAFPEPADAVGWEVEVRAELATTNAYFPIGIDENAAAFPFLPSFTYCTRIELYPAAVTDVEVELVGRVLHIRLDEVSPPTHLAVFRAIASYLDMPYALVDLMGQGYDPALEYWNGGGVQGLSFYPDGAGAGWLNGTDISGGIYIIPWPLAWNFNHQEGGAWVDLIDPGAPGVFAPGDEYGNTVYVPSMTLVPDVFQRISLGESRIFEARLSIANRYDGQGYYQTRNTFVDPDGVVVEGTGYGPPRAFFGSRRGLVLSPGKLSQFSVYYPDTSFAPHNFPEPEITVFDVTMRRMNISTDLTIPVVADEVRVLPDSGYFEARNVNDVQEALNALRDDATHINRSALDKVGEDEGAPTWDGGIWPSSGEANHAEATQEQAEDSAGTTLLSWTAQRIWQAIAKWGDTAASVFKGILGGGYRETLYAVTTTGNLTLDLANGNVQRVTLDAARQLTLPASPGAVAQSFVLIINCAGFTPTWNSSPTIKWLTSDNAAPTLNTTTGKSNVITFVWENANSRWLGFLAGKEN